MTQCKISFQERNVISQTVSFPLLVKNEFVKDEYRLYTGIRSALIIAFKDGNVDTITISERCVEPTDSRFSKVLNGRIVIKI